MHVKVKGLRYLPQEYIHYIWEFWKKLRSIHNHRPKLGLASMLDGDIWNMCRVSSSSVTLNLNLKSLISYIASMEADAGP